MVSAICQEVELRQNYLSDKSLTSIYFGGGTPSLLDEYDLDNIFSVLAKHFTWSGNTEITIEANPDDLTASKLKMLQKTPINRLSIGIQSFADDDLRYMNRAHSGLEAENCVRSAQDLGFQNISTDLIYGSPTTPDSVLYQNMMKMVSSDVPHISAYALTVEEGTALHHFINTGKSKPVSDEAAAHQFDILMSGLSDLGYDHYEISNFAKPNHYAVHNSNYWLGVPYLGVGPAAHSYDGNRIRSWNIAHNSQYIKSINAGQPPIEHETLSTTDAYNEHILIRLRTIWGIDYRDIKAKFPDQAASFMDNIHNLENTGMVVKDDQVYTLTNKGKQLGDKISMELFAE